MALFLLGAPYAIPGRWVAVLVLVLSVQFSAGSPQTVMLDKQTIPVMVNGQAIAYKTAYYGTVYVGGPKPQSFTVLFDTGSAHFLIPSIKCTDITCLLHKRYDQKASRSAVEIDNDGSTVSSEDLGRDHVAISYGTGEVAGNFVNEDVCWGSPALNSDPTTGSNCLRLRVITATEMSSKPFEQFSFDGVLGLSMEALAVSPEFSFVGQLAARGDQNSVFGIFLTNAEGSEITFGGYNTDKISEPIAWVPLSSNAREHWSVGIKSVRVGKKTIPLCDSGDCQAIVDTGTSMLGVPSESVKTFQSLLGRRALGVDEDCALGPGHPLVFELEGGVTVTLDTEDYRRPTATVVRGADGQISKTICLASLLPNESPNVGTKMFVFGGPILRKYYTAFDYKLQRVGFALAAKPVTVTV